LRNCLNNREISKRLRRSQDLFHQSLFFLLTVKRFFDKGGFHILEINFQNKTMSINQSLAHGINILLLYDALTPLLTVAEISKRLGFGQSKTYRLVRTFVKYDLLQVNPGTAQYSLGSNALRLGLLAQQQFNILVIARPFMKDLSILTKETVLLTAVNGTKGVVLDRVESEEPIRYTLFQPGASIPLHAGASSKVLMAYLREEDWDLIIKKEGLKRYTSNTITNRNKLIAHLREVRKRGHALSDQEVDRDVRAIAAPIFNGLGEAVAGLSITGPVYRINKKKVGQLSRLVIEYAKKISSHLGYPPNVSIRGGKRFFSRRSFSIGSSQKPYR
jgi:DNA-binding IclR family transcriptional regulator